MKKNESHVKKIEKDSKRFAGAGRNGMVIVASSIKEAGVNVKTGATDLGKSLESGMRGFGSEGKTFQITDKGIVKGITTAVIGVGITVGITVIGGIVTYFVMKKWYEKKENCE